ncbi:MAG TPA: hypothetical protein VGO57_13735 [Verrucomicrobiae bacterium]|jgi:YbbR domain-containing protein
MRDLFIKDWAWKLFSLFLAVAIWLTVHRILQPETVSPTDAVTKFTYENMSVLVVSSVADVSLYHVSPAAVKVTVSGPPEVMDRLQASQVRALVDLTNTMDDMAPISILTPPEVTLLKVEPQMVSVIPPAKH